MLAYARLFSPLRTRDGDFIYTALNRVFIGGVVSCTREQDAEKRSETMKITNGPAYLTFLAVSHCGLMPISQA
jgi:hypothetical protein